MTPGVPDPTRSLTPHTHREKTGVSLIHSPAMTSRHTNEDGLHCPNCGYPLTRLKSLRCPECGTHYPRSLRQRRPTTWTRLQDHWIAHTWLRFCVLFPTCLVAGIVSLSAFLLLLSLLGASQGNWALIVLWLMGTLLITYLLVFRWTAPRDKACAQSSSHEQAP